MKNTPARKIVTEIVLCAIVILGFTLWYNLALPRNFAVVEDNVLYRSGKGQPFRFENAIKKYNIKTIICLRKPKTEEEGDDLSWLKSGQYVAKENNVEFVYWPMDSRKPFGEKYWVDFIRMTQDPDRVPILVHCAAGKHRTGFLVGIYRLVVDGWPINKVIDEMQSFDFGDTHPEIIDVLKKINTDELRKKCFESK